MNIPEQVLIDEEDRPKLEAMGKWHISADGYCVRKWDKINKKYCYIPMHRIIVNCPKDKVVDHINHNKLDNRKCNLRVVTHQQNTFNKKNIKGYTRKENKYQVQIEVNYKKIYIGLFDTEEEAQNAYLLAKQEYHKI